MSGRLAYLAALMTREEDDVGGLDTVLVRDRKAEVVCRSQARPRRGGGPEGAFGVHAGKKASPERFEHSRAKPNRWQL